MPCALLFIYQKLTLPIKAVQSFENSPTTKMDICKRCNRSFECNPNDITHCQCSATSVSKQTFQFLEKASWGCLCVNCLREINGTLSSLVNETFPKPDEQREGFHYYRENGFFVFTEKYHLLRGSCCQSGCRHCPYGFKKSIV
jgi:hypothetical protein